jgi:hypothetical protein
MYMSIQEAIEVEPLQLLSGRAASRALGVDSKTFLAIAETNGLTPVSSGKRLFWRLAEIQQLVNPGSAEKGSTA